MHFLGGLLLVDRNLLAGNQGSWPQGGRRRSGGHHRGADDAEQ